MPIKIIAEGVYDTAHSVYEAHEILKQKPDAVLMELPVDPFQQIFDDYNSNKIGIPVLKKHLFKAIKKEEREVNHELLKNFLAGEIEEEELEEIEKEGREIHVMYAAKKVGAKLYAIDMPIEELEIDLRWEFEQDHIDSANEVIEHKRLPGIVWELNDIIHYPYYLIEKIMHHPAIKTMNPYKHNVNACTVCKLGTAYDRIASHLTLSFFEKMPLSPEMKREMKIGYILRKTDYLREKYMAVRANKIYNELKKQLHREPKIILIVHLWNAKELDRLITGMI